MLKASLVSSFLGAVLVLSQAPWDNFLVIYLVFPALLLNLECSVKGNTIYKRFIYLFLLIGVFQYFYYFFGFLWIISAFEYREELEGFKYITLFGLPILMIIFTIPSLIIPAIFWNNRIVRFLSLSISLSFGEYLRGNIFSGFAWNNFSYSLAVDDNLMQIFSFTGPYLATFLLIMHSQFLVFLYERRNILLSISLFIILPAIFIFGHFKIDKNEFIDEKKFVIVQPNISQDKKIRNDDPLGTISNFLELSNHDNVDLVVWPESALPFLIEDNDKIIEFIINNLPNNSYLLVGNITRNNSSYRNSALLIDSNSRTQDIYDKVHLVPFGEYMPFKNILSRIPFFKIVTGNIGFDKGDNIRAIKTPIGLVRTVICYEVIFPEEINPNNNNIDAIINLTNDAWFGNSSGPYQHLNSTRFRAIEQGVPVLRAANTGISAVIDPYGRVIKKINLNKSGYIVSSLPNKTKKTLYSKVGDFLFFCVLMLSVLILSLFKMNRKNERI